MIGKHFSESANSVDLLFGRFDHDIGKNQINFKCCSYCEIGINTNFLEMIFSL